MGKKQLREDATRDFSFLILPFDILFLNEEGKTHSQEYSQKNMWFGCLEQKLQVKQFNDTELYFLLLVSLSVLGGSFGQRSRKIPVLAEPN